MITFAPATLDHAREIAPRLIVTPSFCSLWRTRGITPTEAAEEAVRKSPHAWAAYGDAQLGAMFGLSPISMTSAKAMPWLMPTDLVRQYARPFLKASRQFIADARTLYPELYGMVDAENAASVKWLEWLGFKVEGGSEFRNFA